MRKTRPLALAAALLVAACSGEFFPTGPDGGGAVADADPAEAAFVMFKDQIEPMLAANCAACHASQSGASGPGFLYPNPDVYASVMAWPNLVKPRDPPGSRLYAYGRSTQHTGIEWSPDQAELVRQWIMIEIPRDTPPPEQKETTRFVPQIGENTVDLSELAEGLQDAKLTFTAQQLASGIYLTQLTIHAGPAGVHLFHPLFMTYCPQPMPDPVDSFYGLDLVVNPTSSAMLGGGTVVLTNFQPGCEISVHFEKLEPGGGMGGEGDAGPGGPIGGGCVNVTGFTANARTPLSNRCGSCHAGGNATARNAWDLSSINDLSAEGQAAVCGQVKGKINLANEPMSILFQRVEPGQATGHPLTINDPTQFNQFRDAIVSWAVTE